MEWEVISRPSLPRKMAKVEAVVVSEEEIWLVGGRDKVG